MYTLEVIAIVVGSILAIIGGFVVVVLVWEHCEDWLEGKRNTCCKCSVRELRMSAYCKSCHEHYMKLDGRKW